MSSPDETYPIQKRLARSPETNETCSFFVLKECFLLYYPTSYKKTFEKTKRIDLHPKVSLR